MTHMQSLRPLCLLRRHSPPWKKREKASVHSCPPPQEPKEGGFCIPLFSPPDLRNQMYDESLELLSYCNNMFRAWVKRPRRIPWADAFKQALSDLWHYSIFQNSERIIKVTQKWLKSDSRGPTPEWPLVTQKWLKSDSKGVRSHFWVNFGSIWGRPARVAFGSLVGHFNSVCVSGQLGGRPLRKCCWLVWWHPSGPLKAWVQRASICRLEVRKRALGKAQTATMSHKLIVCLKGSCDNTLLRRVVRRFLKNALRKARGSYRVHTHQGGHATTRFLEGFLEGSLTASAS